MSCFRAFFKSSQDEIGRDSSNDESCTGVPRAQETAPPLGPPQGPGHEPTAGSQGSAVFMSEVPLYAHSP